MPDVNPDAIESQAMPWPYAASLYLGLNPKVVFHEGGYRGQSAALLMNFELGVPPGVSGLQAASMIGRRECGVRRCSSLPAHAEVA